MSTSPITLTNGDVQVLVSRAVRPSARVSKHSLEPFAETRNGVLGSHYLLKVEISRENDDDDDVEVVTFFVKTRPESAYLRDLVMDECNYRAESCFYSDILPKMLEVYRQGEKWCAQCHMVTADFLVFEDLRARNYAIPEDSPVDEPSLTRAIESLARLHACSVLAEAKLGESFKEAYPDALAEKVYSDATKLGKSTLMAYETMRLTAEKLDLDASLVPRIHDLVHRLVRPKSGELNVVCHGDLWKNNLMFDSTPQPDCLLIDFQLLRYASPAVDLAFLVFVNTTPEFRRAAEPRMFDRWYATFRDTLLRNGYLYRDADVPTRERMLRDYRERRIVGMSYAATYLPGLYLHAEDVGRIFNDVDGLVRWFFVNRIDVIAATMDRDPGYAGKVRDVFEEFFDEARRVLA